VREMFTLWKRSSVTVIVDESTVSKRKVYIFGVSDIFIS
jgi:hypothetical protein